MSVGVIGLGKLGLPFALTLAQAGYHVLVHDADDDVLRAIAGRRSHIDEPGVQDMLEQFTLERVVPVLMSRQAHVIFIVVPTPSKEDGTFDDSLVLQAIGSLGEAPRDRRRVVAVVSTLSPGFTKSVKPFVELLRYRLVYAPTLIALGTVIHDLTQPDVLLVGGENVTANVDVSTILRAAAPTAPIVYTDLESAAIAKLASNAFVTMKIAFANCLAQLCDRYLGDVDDVTEMLGHNQRIGPKSLTAGAGFGGPCFPRDTRAFYAAGARLGHVVDELNAEHLTYVADVVFNKASGPTRFNFTVLGHSYKDGSNYRIESFGDMLHAELVRRGAYPVAAQDADAVIIAQPLRDTKLTVLKKGAVVFDLWRTHRYLDANTDIHYVPLGGRP